jgi:acyl-CoA synthetase (AMP-forming)/AMP-acid ligase II
LTIRATCDCGRKDEIVTAGVHVFPEDVEQVLEGLPGVHG